MNTKAIFLSALTGLFLGCAPSDVPAPEPCDPVPSERQLAWHETEFYAFICLTTNTFNDLEWGYGDADPNIFCPEKLNAEEWMKVCKEAGMNGAVITAKHHDGFCLWPSEYTDYSVKSSKWRDGKGDVLEDLSKACQKYEMKFGVYLSPWDRHDMRYGTPEYIEYYRNQLRELCTNYGPIFEFWEDGANGGDGYYGGLCEQRKIDGGTYYKWDETNAIIYELQPQACIFGGNVRWCGNESGYIDEPVWNATSFDENALWRPFEVDVSIRPGWFWHESENDKVKTVEQLVDIYYNSIGRGANLILNLPPNKDGLLSDEDVRALEGMGEAIRREFSNCLNGQIKKAEASNVRGDSRKFCAKNACDEDRDSYWAADDSVMTADLTFTFKEPTTVNRAMIREYLPLGQRIGGYSLEALGENGEWTEVYSGTTIGNKHLLRFDDVKTKALRLNITEAKACPILSEVKFYAAPAKE